MNTLADGSRSSRIDWKLTDDGVLKFEGSGYMHNYGDMPISCRPPWSVYSAFIKKVVIEPGIKTMGTYAFYECVSLEEAFLPEGLKTIGDYAFRLCSSLKEIVLPDTIIRIGTSAFSGCTSLKHVTLPSGLAEIEDFMFVRCQSLEKIYIPKTVKSIGLNAFQGCRSLKEIFFEGDKPRILSEAFYDVCAAAYYPKGNKSWKNRTLKNYGGDICWTGI